ncbi:MAG: quinol:cytochrome C oxidoreductase [Acidobacteriota bacterium]
MSDAADLPRTVSAASLRVESSPAWNRLPTVGSLMAAVGLLGSLAIGLGGNAAAQTQLWHSWLVAALFVLTIALGGMFFVLIHHATQAGWSVTVRRIAENAMAAIPFIALLFVPLLFVLSELFPWSRAAEVAHDPLLAHKAALLNTPFFVGRTVVYFLLWSAIAIWFNSLSRRQDDDGDQEITRRMRRASPPALIVFALTVTFASFDWLMSLDAHWYSTIFGVYFFAGCLVGIYAFMSLVAIGQRRAGLLPGVVTTEHVNLLGMLLFGFVAFWAYIGFSQYLLIWYANLPEETGFFAMRLAGSWRPITIGLVLGHFIVPFFFLMPRTIKRNSTALAVGAAWMLLMHALDLHWLVMPILHPEGFTPALVDVTTMIGAVGLFLAAFGRASRRQALVPVRDPRLTESLLFDNI